MCGRECVVGRMWLLLWCVRSEIVFFVFVFFFCFFGGFLVSRLRKRYRGKVLEVSEVRNLGFPKEILVF